MSGPPDWRAKLARVSAGGLRVVVASPRERNEVTRLLQEMLESSRFSHDAVEASECDRWAQTILSSHLWLVLLLKDGDQRSLGLAVCEYIAYDVDVNSRVLKCKHFHVRHHAQTALFAPATLLLDAMVEAARRSPCLKDIFIVSTGAQRFARLGKVLSHRGFRRIGTQHIGFGQARHTSAHSGLKEIVSVHSLTPGERDQLHTMAKDFLRESARASLGTVTLDFERLLPAAMGAGDISAAAFLACVDGEVIGFIAGRSDAPPLQSRRYLCSTFFYVKPRLRASTLALKLFDAFAAKARQLGLDGALLGTSSGIATDRVCRLLALRGFEHVGDVLALRVSAKATR